MTFCQWLYTQRKQDNAAGEFARAAIADKHKPRAAKDPTVWITYLRRDDTDYFLFENFFKTIDVFLLVWSTWSGEDWKFCNNCGKLFESKIRDCSWCTSSECSTIDMCTNCCIGIHSEVVKGCKRL